MTTSEKKILAKLNQHGGEILAATPGLKIQAYQKGRLKIHAEFGRVFRFYDLASLTKIIFTASILGRGVDEGWFRPAQVIGRVWPEFPFPQIELQEFMTHTARMPWWLPLYRSYKGPRETEGRWSQLEQKLLHVRRHRSSRAVYSDVDLWVLGQVMTRIRDKSLTQLWDDLRSKKVTGTMHFNSPNRRFRKSLYAPTERCPWRGRILQGEVHDENAWALGGIAPHAGLFGTVEDVGNWGLALRRTFQGCREIMAPATLKKFVRRHTRPKQGDWGWLFMKPTPGRGSAGRYFSPSSFGHTGFTGTSLWMDPRRDLLVVILSNRVHPTRKNSAFVKLRPRLHDWIVAALE